MLNFPMRPPLLHELIDFAGRQFPCFKLAAHPPFLSCFNRTCPVGEAAFRLPQQCEKNRLLAREPDQGRFYSGFQVGELLGGLQENFVRGLFLARQRIRLATITRLDRELADLSVPACPPVGTDNGYQLPPQAAHEWLAHPAHLPQQAVAQISELGEGDLNGMALILVGSSQAVLVIGGQREFERVQARALANLGVDALELRKLPGQKPVKAVRQEVSAVAAKNDDRREPVTGDHPLGVFGNGHIVDSSAGLRPGVGADQR